MSIDTTTAEGKRRELRNSALLIAKRQLQDVLSEMDFLTAATASGDRRNTLTDVNIHLMSADKLLNGLSSEED